MAETAVMERVPRVSVAEKIGYGVGDMAANFIWRNMTTFLGFFYTDVFGLRPAAVATLFLVARIFDGFADLTMGALADRTESRWGKFRPWILFSILPLAALTVLTFTTPDLPYDGKLVYAYVTYIGLLVAYTANNIPYGAMTGVISADPVERKSVSAYRFFFAYLGGLVVYGLTLYAVPFFGLQADGSVDSAIGFKWTMIAFSAIGSVLFVITFLTTRERVRPPKQQKTPIRTDARDLLTNGPWVVLFFVGVLYCAATALKAGTTLYYFTYYIRQVDLFGRIFTATDLAVLFMVTGALAAMAGTLLTERTVRAFGTNRTMRGCLLVALASSAALYPLAPGHVLSIVALSMVFEFVGGTIVTLFFAMLGDAADYSEWKHGRRATALVFAAGSVATKFGPGMAGWLVGVLLAYFSYVPNQAQSESTLLGIRALMSVLPALAVLAAFGVFLVYTLNDRTLEQIEDDLTARRAQQAV